MRSSPWHRGTSPPAFSCLHFPGYALTGAQLLAAIERAAAALGLEPAGGFRRGAMGWAAIRIGGLVVPLWREIAAMSYLWRVPHALDGDALAAVVGSLPTTPIEEALRRALRDLGLGVHDGRSPRPRGLTPGPTRGAASRAI